MKQNLLQQIQTDFLASQMDKTKIHLFTQHIKQSQALSAELRFEIYQSSITAGLGKTLAEIYPVCEKLLGQHFFLGMAYQYIEATPSISPNLIHYGQSFADFVAEFKPAQQLPYLGDVCRLEWAWHQAHYSAPDTELNIAALMQLDESEQANCIFKLPSSASRICTNYPIYQIWLVNQADYPDEPRVNLNQGGERLLIFNRDTDIIIDTLSDDEWQVLDAIDNQLPLAKICEQFADGEHTVDIIQLLPIMLKKGWLSSFYQQD